MDSGVYLRNCIAGFASRSLGSTQVHRTCSTFSVLLENSMRSTDDFHAKTTGSLITQSLAVLLSVCSDRSSSLTSCVVCPARRTGGRRESGAQFTPLLTTDMQSPARTLLPRPPPPQEGRGGVEEYEGRRSGVAHTVCRQNHLQPCQDTRCFFRRRAVVQLLSVAANCVQYAPSSRVSFDLTPSPLHVVTASSPTHVLTGPLFTVPSSPVCLSVCLSLFHLSLRLTEAREVATRLFFLLCCSVLCRRLQFLLSDIRVSFFSSSSAPLETEMSIRLEEVFCIG